MNTRRRRRVDSITSIASLIERARVQLGGIDEVARTTGIGVEMLRRFLFVKQLSPAVQKLVASREIDNLNVVIHLLAHESADQLDLANAYLRDAVSAEDIRALAPMRRAQPKRPLTELVALHLAAKDKHVYVAKFRFPRGVGGRDDLKRAISRLIGNDCVISVRVVGHVASVEVTPAGRDALRRAARLSGVTLRAFLEGLAGGGSRA
jgi:hydrogenase maturation factor HypE